MSEELSAVAFAQAYPIIEARAAISRAAETETLAEQAKREAGDAAPPGSEIRFAYWQALAARRAAWEHLYKLQDAECKKFAASRGWRVYQRGHIYGRDLIAGHMGQSHYDGDHSGCIDHRNCFVRSRPGKTSHQSYRYPAAILTHTYGPYEACEKYAREYGLGVERLPWSWYYPGETIAALFTTKAVI